MGIFATLPIWYRGEILPIKFPIHIWIRRQFSEWIPQLKSISYKKSSSIRSIFCDGIFATLPNWIQSTLQSISQSANQRLSAVQFHDSITNSGGLTLRIILPSPTPTSSSPPPTATSDCRWNNQPDRKTLISAIADRETTIGHNTSGEMIFPERLNGEEGRKGRGRGEERGEEKRP